MPTLLPELEVSSTQSPDTMRKSMLWHLRRIASATQRLTMDLRSIASFAAASASCASVGVRGPAEERSSWFSSDRMASA